MKKSFRIIIVAILAAMVLVSLSSCKKNDNESTPETEKGTTSTTIASVDENATDYTGVIDSSQSPKKISKSVPAEDYPLNYSEIDISSYTEKTNDNDEKYLVSPDGSFSVTYLANDSGTVYALKYEDIANGVNFYYGGEDEKLYCVSTEVYSDETCYYINSDGTVKGIKAITFNSGTEKVETVYNEKGVRAAAVCYENTEFSSDATFLNGNLVVISGDDYDAIAKNYVITIA